MNLADRIKTIRKSLHLSQTEFGEALGTTRSVIGNYEYGRVEPKKPFLGLICSVFNVNSDWLNTGAGQMFAPSPLPSVANQELHEVMTIFNALSPLFQKYALQQIKGLWELQNQYEE
jgi:transcriptional regulator with XRE-family HTH domain